MSFLGGCDELGKNVNLFLRTGRCDIKNVNQKFGLFILRTYSGDL